MNYDLSLVSDKARLIIDLSWDLHWVKNLVDSRLKLILD